MRAIPDPVAPGEKWPEEEEDTTEGIEEAEINI
jgi:hypothetical protein